MPRRGHKKSRLGCAECKKRHLKCDETKPSCVNCKTAGTACSYEKENSHLAVSNGFVPSASTSPGPPIDTNFNDLPIKPIPFRSPGEIDVNLDHLELLHNFQSEAFQSSVANKGIGSDYKETAIREGFRHPFLMYELLALSAFHLSIIRPERAPFYRQQSSDLQALAVRGFNEIMMSINDDNYIAAFLFSSMMGKHASCQMFVSLAEDSSFSRLLDQLADTIRMIRGILVVTNGFWEKLSQSELKVLLRQGSFLAKGKPADEECKPLREMLGHADLSAKSKEVLDGMVTELQRAFTVERDQCISDHATSTAFAWLVRASDEYTNSVQERRPEALVILAYYAVLLHRKRASWTVLGAGRIIILAIRDYLGPHWIRWLEWPLSAIGEAQQSLIGTPSTQDFQSPASFAQRSS